MSQTNIVHVGLPKTATTFLQRHFFGELGFSFYSTDTACVWPEELGWIVPVNRFWLEDFYSMPSVWSREERESYFSSQVDSKVHEWIEAGKAYVKRQSGPILLSAEGLVGFSVPMAQCMGRILQHIGFEKILLVYRNQMDWSFSLWKQLVLTEDRFARFVSYQQLFGETPESLSESVIDMDWSAYIKAYMSLFGEENVLFIPYELLVMNPPDFFQRIQSFMGNIPVPVIDVQTRENPTKEGDVYIGWAVDQWEGLIRNYKLRFLLHRLGTPLMRKTGNVSNMFLRTVSMTTPSEKMREEVLGRFEDSNRELAKISGFDLKAYGYY